MLVPWLLMAISSLHSHPASETRSKGLSISFLLPLGAYVKESIVAPKDRERKEVSK